MYAYVVLLTVCILYILDYKYTLIHIIDIAQLG
jgi:hypothetical protein